MAYVKRAQMPRNFGVGRCLLCGKTYMRTGTRQRWCSKECQRAAQHKERKLRVKGDTARAKCPVCERWFEFPRDKVAVYCSIVCEEKAREERKRKEQLITLSEHLRAEMERRRDMDRLALELARRNPRRNGKNMSIADIAREARAAGLSYGAYCAKMGI